MHDLCMDHFVRERQAQILAHLRDTGRVLAQDLAMLFNVSEDTVRRDLREMAARGECERVYGGALLPPGGQTVPLRIRMGEATGRKDALGRKVAELIPDGSVVFFDAGSTNLAIARSLSADVKLTAVTNTPAIAAELAGREGVELIMLGGRVDPAVGAAIDAMAIRQLETIRPDLCILGACGLTLDEGLAADLFEDAAFKRLASAASRRSLAAITSDKLGHRAAFHVRGLHAPLALVLEADAATTLVAELATAGADTHICAPTNGADTRNNVKGNT